METHDSWIKIFEGYSFKETFLEYETSYTAYLTSKVWGRDDVILYINYEISSVETTHERDVYKILDVLEAMGGINEVFVFTVGIIVFPISEFSYNLKLIQKLFLVTTSDDSFLKKQDLKK